MLKILMTLLTLVALSAALSGVASAAETLTCEVLSPAPLEIGAREDLVVTIAQGQIQSVTRTKKGAESQVLFSLSPSVRAGKALSDSDPCSETNGILESGEYRIYSSCRHMGDFLTVISFWATLSPQSEGEIKMRIAEHGRPQIRRALRVGRCQ